MIPVTREIYVLLLVKKFLENESLRKRKEKMETRRRWIWLWIWNGWKVSFRLCRLRTVPLMAVLTKFEQY